MNKVKKKTYCCAVTHKTQESPLYTIPWNTGYVFQKKNCITIFVVVLCTLNNLMIKRSINKGKEVGDRR